MVKIVKVVKVLLMWHYAIEYENSVPPPTILFYAII